MFSVVVFIAWIEAGTPRESKVQLDKTWAVKAVIYLLSGRLIFLLTDGIISDDNIVTTVTWLATLLENVEDVPSCAKKKKTEQKV